ncbi:MAG TPA: hypothetical protein VFP71_01955, partial [Candidatus Angelobacter sp.]|nr:hypothetical protein [Candidatus Angelobacter sp.]
MKKRIAFSSRVGNRWIFAIEFEVIGDPPRVWNEWWGSLWLWIDGRVVGTPFEIEMVASGFDSLLESLYQLEQQAENRTSAFLSSLPGNQALDLVMWAQYGEDESPVGFDGNRELLRVHEVLPRGSPFFDGWQAILLSDRLQERFIFRQEGGQVNEVKWPIGTFE